MISFLVGTLLLAQSTTPSDLNVIENYTRQFKLINESNRILLSMIEKNDDIIHMTATAPAFACEEKVKLIVESSDLNSSTAKKISISSQPINNMAQKLFSEDTREYRYPKGDIRRWFNYWGGLFK